MKRFSRFLPPSQWPYILALFWLTCYFAIGSLKPYHVQGDVALLLKSVQQFVAGQSPSLQLVILPSVTDLAQDVQTWIAWFPPGIALTFYPLIATGLPLGIATKFTAYGLMLSGCWGWLRLSRALALPPPALMLAACTLPLYALSVTGAAKLESGDILPFALMPWLYGYALWIVHHWRQKPHQSWAKRMLQSGSLGLLLGCTYWVKYSAFLAACSVCCYLVIEIVWRSGRLRFSWYEKIGLLGMGLVSFAIAPVALSWLNQHFTQTLNYVEQVNQAKALISPHHPIGYWLPLFLMAAPGVIAFQASLFWKHLIFFSDAWLPWFRAIDLRDRIFWLAIACLPTSIMVLHLVAQARQFLTQSLWVFCLCIGFLPLVPLAYLSQTLKLNLLIVEPRYGASYFILIELLILKGLCQRLAASSVGLRARLKKSLTWVMIVFLLVLPNGFHVLYFMKDQVWESRSMRYEPTANQLFVPSLSLVSSKTVIQAINQVQKTPRDVVITAIDHVAPFDLWLEISQRCLPLSMADISAFAHTHGFNNLNLDSTRPLTTTVPLRVILVISRSLIARMDLNTQLQHRFPQATRWSAVANLDPELSAVEIYFADLQVLYDRDA